MKSIFTVCLMLLSTLSYAETGDNLKDMISNAATRGGMSVTFTSPATATASDVVGLNRTAVDLGGVRFRSPVQSFNLISFSKPNLSAGCSGIDLTLGSFSFLSRDELIAMFRSIASNALTYGFGQAIKGMCADCWTMMNSLQQKMQDLNQMFSNTCAIAKCIDEEGCIDQEMQNVGCMFSSGYGKSDYAECKKGVADKASEVAADAKNNGGGTDDPGYLYGNLTYQAMQDTVTGDLSASMNLFLDSIGIPGVEPQDLIMSLLGTVISKDGENATPIGATIKLSNLFEAAQREPGEISPQIMTCSGEEQTVQGVVFGCMGVTHVDLAGVKDIDTWVKEQFEQISLALSDYPLTDAKVQALTPFQTHLLNYIDQHVFKAVVSGSRGSQKMALNSLSKQSMVVSNRIKLDFSKALIDTISQIKAAGSKNDKWRGYTNTLTQVENELHKQSLEYKTTYDAALAVIADDRHWLHLKRIFEGGLIQNLAEMEY